MKSNKYLKSLFYISSFLFLFLAGMIFLSPYGAKDNLKAVITEITIDAPVEKLFNYLGDSSNAKQWSSFVKDIKPLNQKLVLDGQKGSKRRCFGKEQGVVWDEEILEVQPNQKRLLSVFNAKGFPMMATNLLTEQIYEVAPNGKTKLTLSLFFEEGKRDFVSELKMYFAAYFVEDIFLKNLEQIKNINEIGES